MAKRFKRFKRGMTVLCMATALQFGPCLPEDYFLQTGRAAAVTLADIAIELVLVQVALALGLPTDSITGLDSGDTSTN